MPLVLSWFSHSFRDQNDDDDGDAGLLVSVCVFLLRDVDHTKSA
jgi:hypothetical protein